MVDQIFFGTVTKSKRIAIEKCFLVLAEGHGSSAEALARGRDSQKLDLCCRLGFPEFEISDLNMWAKLRIAKTSAA